MIELSFLKSSFHPGIYMLFKLISHALCLQSATQTHLPHYSSSLSLWFAVLSLPKEILDHVNETSASFVITSTHLVIMNYAGQHSLSYSEESSCENLTKRTQQVTGGVKLSCITATGWSVRHFLVYRNVYGNTLTVFQGSSASLSWTWIWQCLTRLKMKESRDRNCLHYFWKTLCICRAVELCRWLHQKLPMPFSCPLLFMPSWIPNCICLGTLPR